LDGKVTYSAVKSAIDSKNIGESVKEMIRMLLKNGIVKASDLRNEFLKML